MAGWLTLMLVMAIAGREATRELNVFELMEVRSILGFFMLYPLIHINGGFAAMRRRGRCSISDATSCTMPRNGGASREGRSVGAIRPRQLRLLLS